MHSRRGTSILIAAIAMVMAGHPAVDTAGGSSALPFLDRYLAGDFDRAVAAAAGIRDPGDVRDAIVRDGPAWIRIEEACGVFAALGNQVSQPGFNV